MLIILPFFEVYANLIKSGWVMIQKKEVEFQKPGHSLKNDRKCPITMGIQEYAINGLRRIWCLLRT